MELLTGTVPIIIPYYFENNEIHRIEDYDLHYLIDGILFPLVECNCVHQAAYILAKFSKIITSSCQLGTFLGRPLCNILLCFYV